MATPEAEPVAVSPDKVIIDLDDLTFEEIEQVEEICGLSIDTFAVRGSNKGKMMRALYYIARRRTNPKYKWEQSAKVRISDIEVRVGSQAVPNSDGGASGPSPQ